MRGISKTPAESTGDLAAFQAFFRAGRFFLSREINPLLGQRPTVEAKAYHGLRVFALQDVMLDRAEEGFELARRAGRRSSVAFLKCVVYWGARTLG